MDNGIFAHRAPAGAEPGQVLRIGVHERKQDLVALLQSLDLRADLDDLADALMADHDRIHRFREALERPVQQLDVGAADAAGDRLHQCLMLVIPGLVDLFDRDFPVLRNDDCFHR